MTVQLPDAAGVYGPAPGVVVMALPYDRDSLLTSLENAAPRPRPSTRELDSLFQAFRAPFEESTRLAARVERLRAALRRLEGPGTDPAAVLAIRDSLVIAEAAAAAAAERLAATRAAVNPRIDSLRRLMREWEDEAFGSYGDITQSLTGNQLTATIADTTDSGGEATLWLPPGTRTWWIHARSFNSGDPNAEWYWNVVMDAPRITLDSTNARLRPRY